MREVMARCIPFIRSAVKSVPTIASAGVSFGLQAIGYISGNNVVQSDATINNIYMLVALIPVLTCVLELIGIGAIFNLDKEQTKEMYAELKQRRE